MTPKVSLPNRYHPQTGARSKRLQPAGVDSRRNASRLTSTSHLDMARAKRKFTRFTRSVTHAKTPPLRTTIAVIPVKDIKRYIHNGNYIPSFRHWGEEFRFLADGSQTGERAKKKQKKKPAVLVSTVDRSNILSASFLCAGEFSLELEACDPEGLKDRLAETLNHQKEGRKVTFYI